jgi:hypothetical protein
MAINNRRSQMSKLKIALIVAGIALSSAAQAFEARLGNGSTWVTINPTASMEARQPLSQAPNRAAQPLWQRP